MKLVALLKGVNVGGNRKISMPELRSLTEDLGFAEVKTYINSGNLIFESGKIKKAQAGKILDQAIVKQFGFPVDLIVRSAAQWRKIVRENPFRLRAKESPKSLHLGLSKLRLAPGVAAALTAKASHGEKIRVVGEAIWIEFLAGVGKSKLTPRVIDQAAGSPVTLRNWNTVLKLHEMLEDT
jgi:uncharacterized protein (DUF1697 family)